MYEQFYCLTEKPFSLTPDPEFLFVNSDYQSALDKVLYGIRRREGFTVIVGDVGTGKTTLCWALLGRLEKDLQTALILNPMLTAEDMLRAILQDFGVTRRKFGSGETLSPAERPDPGWMQGMTRKELLDELNFFLLERAEEDVFCVLIIDEAQDLSMEVLEQLRLLSNLETSKKKLLQIIFVGQIEFNEKLKTRQLRSLNQRISIRYELKPLPEQDTARYVAHRLKVAKASERLQFTGGAIREVYRYSRGYPRLVNLICDRALLAGCSEHAWTVTAKIVRQAAAGLSGREANKRMSWVPRGRSMAREGVVLAVALMGLALFWGWRSIGSSTSKVPEPLPVRPPSIAQPASPAPSQPEAAVAPAAAVEAGQYYVQVHSFLIEHQAASAVRQLQSQGFTADVRTQVRRNGTRWFAVVVGPFGDFESARGCVAALRKARRGSGIIVRTRTENR